ncbi:MAG: tripartite tricarboxylate transporter substrate binding protein [Thermodesulfobacteriota bacterium]
MKWSGLLKLTIAALAMGLILAHWSPAGAWEMTDQGECIAGSNPGGGWDAICRYSSAVLQKTGLVKPKIYVTNMPGGSGAVAIANVVAKRKGDPNLIVACSNALTFTIAMKRTPHNYNDVIPIAQIGIEIGGLWVKPDSKYKTLKDVIESLKTDPKSVSFAGGSAPGSLDHIKVALFAKAIGVEPTKILYVPFQGGGEALTATLGGHTEVAILDISEVAGQLEAGNIRGLTVLSEKRSSKFKDIPSAYEQGVKVDFPVWRGVYMAPGVPADAVKFWIETLQKMVKTKEWDAEREKLGWEASYKFGDEFTKSVKEEDIRYQALLKELGFLK